MNDAERARLSAVKAATILAIDLMDRIGDKSQGFELRQIEDAVENLARTLKIIGVLERATETARGAYRQPSASRR